MALKLHSKILKLKSRYFHMYLPKLKLLLIILFLFFSAGFTTPMVAQGKNIIGKRTTYKKPRKNRNQPKSLPQIANTKNLAQKITRGKITDAEKAESIFNWIVNNISYDNELRVDNALQQKIYISEENIITNVLERKKALCGGYAYLFEKLCADVGLQAKVIHGYTKTPGVQKIPKQANHSWNAIHINGVWQLLDITWAISQSTADAAKSYWYLTPASQFIKTHYPEDREWAFNNSIKSKDSFFFD